MNRTGLLFVVLMLAWPLTQLGGWCFYRTSDYNSAEIKGEYLIFISHCLDLENIWLNQEDLGDYEEEEFNWIYGWGLGIPVKKLAEIKLWLYGPFWSVWPMVLKPTGMELQVRLLLMKKDSATLSISPAYVSTWGSEEYEMKDYVETYECSTKGFRLPLTFSYRSSPRTEFTVSGEFAIDWMNLKGRAYDWRAQSYVSQPSPIAHGGVGFSFMHQIRPITLSAELGVHGYQGITGKLKTQITYGLAMGTVW